MSPDTRNSRRARDPRPAGAARGRRAGCWFCGCRAAGIEPAQDFSRWNAALPRRDRCARLRRMRALGLALLLALVLAGRAGSAGQRPTELLYLDDSSPPAVVATRADGT